MSEERAPYHAQRSETGGLDGVQRIGDIIRQLLENGELVAPECAVNTNGHNDQAKRRYDHE